LWRGALGTESNEPEFQGRTFHATASTEFEGSSAIDEKVRNPLNWLIVLGDGDNRVGIDDGIRTHQDMVLDHNFWL
jgi:hypothetical protein